LFVYLRLNKKYVSVVNALERSGQPVIRIDLRDAYDLGGEFLRWEIATAVAGVSLDIDPFDQPNVQESKDNTKRLLVDRQWPPAEPTVPVARRDAATRLKAHLKLIKPGDYVALTAYVARTSKTEKALRAIRAAIRDKYKAATTVGYGPRFLHSTGQLHKGGADNILCVQFVADVGQDEAIPGEAYSFGVLEAAQALGDFQSLKSRGRRALRMQLSAKPEADLAAVAAMLAPAKAKPAAKKKAVRKARKK
jgi:hypothetical protein